MRFTDGTYEVRFEDLSQVRHPRGRFAKPVSVAIFFYGYEHDDAEPQPVEPDVLQDGGGGPTVELSAPDVAQPRPDLARPLEHQTLAEDDPRRQIPRSPPRGIHFDTALQVKGMLSRVHRNMGHPSAGELKKMLALSGAKDQKIMAAVDSMRCDACERTKAPPRPPLASVPSEGYQQFGDVVQCDIFYCRDIASQSYPILGLICESTDLHAATVLESRSPEETFKKFMSSWGKPYGLPLTIRTDPDGAFRGQDTGQLEAELNSLGVYIDYCPPEAHNRIGLVERRNATLRCIMEKFIDSGGLTGLEAMEQATTAATYAKNSGAWSSGRPPYVAALGRMPRVGLDLLSCPRGLVIGSTQSEAQRQSDVMRIEAQQHLAATSIDSTLRRALLRRTPNKNSMHQSAQLSPTDAGLPSLARREADID